MVTESKRPGHGSKGWRKMETPKEIEATIHTMLNKILMDANPLAHAGQYAALVNSLVNLKKYALDVEEVIVLKKKVAEIERAQGR